MLRPLSTEPVFRFQMGDFNPEQPDGRVYVKLEIACNAHKLTIACPAETIGAVALAALSAFVLHSFI